LDALKWQNGKQEDKDAVKGYFSAYEDKESKRLRGVLKQISFSNEFTPDALDSIIYMSAPPPRPQEVGGIPSGEAFGVPTVTVEPSDKKHKETPALKKEIGQAVEFDEALPVHPETGTARGDGSRIAIGGLDFMRVPAGKFVMGSKEGDELDYERERPQHTFEIPYDYWMAKFILTNQQFAEFAKEASYRTTAEEQGSGYTFDGKEWKDLKGADWKHPIGPKSDIKDKKDHPVILASWDDAMAYCKWFNGTFKSKLGDLLLRLPTEAEWEKTARGAYGNEWPWGNEFDKIKCNSVEGGKGGTTPVGAYSSLGGDSPYGCADMVGNVWEWTHSLYGKYPYEAKDGRENEESRDSRVLRGGSFDLSRSRARCAFRYDLNPDYRLNLIGFRLCVAPHPASGI
jgi:formylglycine-generating enzyme required for sulfatase activity